MVVAKHGITGVYLIHDTVPRPVTDTKHIPNLLTYIDITYIDI